MLGLFVTQEQMYQYSPNLWLENIKYQLCSWKEQKSSLDMMALRVKVQDLLIPLLVP